MQPRTRAVLFLLLGLILLGALLAYVGPSQVVRALRDASPLHLALAFASYCLFFLLRGIRWKLLFTYSAPDVKLRSTTSLSAIGWLANSVLPLKGGDVLRAAVLARREKVGLATSAATVGLERVLDLAGVALFAAAGLLLIPRATPLPSGLERALAIVWILPITCVLLLILLVRWRRATVRMAGTLLRPLGRVGAKLVDFGDTVLAGSEALGRRPALLAKLVPLTLLISLSQTLVFTFLVMAFLQPTVLLAFAGSAVFLLSFVVSITPGNVGTYEAAFAAVFIALGSPANAAVPAGVLTHIVTTLTVAILGGVGLFALGTSGPSDLFPQRPVRAAQGGGSS